MARNRARHGRSADRGPGAIPLPNTAARSAGAVPAEALAKWQETVAMILPGPSPAECSAALIAFGETLAANGYTEAAHVWFVLACFIP